MRQQKWPQKGMTMKTSLDYDDVQYTAKERLQMERNYVRELSDEEIEQMVFDGDVYAADGCKVEPDGVCPHGFKSPLLLLGLI